jgi:hypothetical protein
MAVNRVSVMNRRSQARLLNLHLFRADLNRAVADMEQVKADDGAIR